MLFNKLLRGGGKLNLFLAFSLFFVLVFSFCREEKKDNTATTAGAALLLSQSASGPYKIGGTITGLTASGLVLQNNTADDLTVSANATSFTFSTKTTAYAVTVKTQPSGLSCTVSGGSGTATADITSVSVSCSCTRSLLAGAMQGQGCELSLTTAVTTLTAASFTQAQGITYDGTNLYVADYSDNTIKKVVISSGVVTTFAGTGSSGSTDATGTSASFDGPFDVTTDGTNLYVADQSNHKIRKIVISSGVVTTLAGTGSSGSTDATGTSASFNGPSGITTDGTNLYVAEQVNHKIRKIGISSRVVTTLAGTGSSGSTDATGTSASFNNPMGITTDGTNLYVADFSNHKIRKVVISSGVVTTLAGTGSSGSTDATGTSASFTFPRFLTTDGTNLYIADSNNRKVRKIVISSGVVTTLAGSGSSGSTDATGTSVSFNTPMGITTDGTSLYLSDHGNNKIRKIQ